MNVSENLLTLFSATVELRDGEPVLTVPERELDVGSLDAGETYRVAVLPQVEAPTSTDGSTAPEPAETNTGSSARSGETPSSPPVEEGELLEVEVEDLGDQGDGIARIGPGYVVFIPETTVGDRVTVEISQARENFAFAEVVQHEPVSG